MVKKYLVTGASGFIAMHVVNQLLKEGQSVRGTIRSLNDKEKVDALKKLGPIELVEADLDDPESWKKAVKGVDIVIHVATPTTTAFSMGESETIKQAVNGTLNVLNAALNEGIKRVVVTSSTITLIDDQADKNMTISESNWGDLNKITSQFSAAYQKSKIHAEKAAWDFYEKHKKDGFKLATVLPSFSIGPIISSINKSSVNMFFPNSDKTLEDIHSMIVPVCDVRDVALAHVRAAQLDEAVGHRFIIASDDLYHSTADILKLIKNEGFKLNKNIAEPLDKDEYKNTRIDNSNMRKILKIQPTEIKKSALDMVQSFLEFGIINQ